MADGGEDDIQTNTDDDDVCQGEGVNTAEEA